MSRLDSVLFAAAGQRIGTDGAELISVLDGLRHEQRQAILDLTYELLEAATRGERIEPPKERLAGTADWPVLGVFVSLHHGTRLRGCCGSFGRSAPLGEALVRAAAAAATGDPRFPSVPPAEVPLLNYEVWLLDRPLVVPARGEERLNHVVIGKHGLVVSHRNGRQGLLLPSVAVEHHLDPREFLEHTCRKAGLPPDAWLDDETELLTFEGIALHAEPRQREDAAAAVRPAAHAGTFYPAEPRALDALVRDLLGGTPRRPHPWPAVMVPHAGLRYSGAIAAQVFNRVQFPRSVIVLSPNHRGYGAPWAVTPHAAWGLPGGSVPADPELARGLSEAIPGLELDAEAHQEEHGIEVELPFIRALAPESRVLGIAIGAGGFEQCRDFARHFAAFLRTRPEPPLLVISSDMNHFAPEPENRRLDMLAVQALLTRSPEELERTIRGQRISMCGVLPALIVLETLGLLGRLERAELVGYTNSGMVSGDTSRVVGYAGMVFGS